MAGRLQIKIIFLLFAAYIAVACHREVNPDTVAYYYSTDSVKDGDIILRKSYGLVSEIIAIQLHDTIDISHCGIIVRDSGQTFRVIHSLSKKVSETDGVQECSLDDFMSDSQPQTVKVLRFKNDHDNRIAQGAVSCLTRKIPFDDSFNSADTNYLYCSELPIHIIRSAYGTDISYGAAKPKFSIFLNPLYFREIPFVRKKLPE